MFLQTLAAAKFPDLPVEITAAHVPYLMGQYQEGDYQPLFAAMSRSRGLSEQLVHWVHNFMDRECLYGDYAIDLCSGWGRNKLYLLGQHYQFVDVMDQDREALDKGKEYADLMGLDYGQTCDSRLDEFVFPINYDLCFGCVCLGYLKMGARGHFLAFSGRRCGGGCPGCP